MTSQIILRSQLNPATRMLRQPNPWNGSASASMDALIHFHLIVVLLPVSWSLLVWKLHYNVIFDPFVHPGSYKINVACTLAPSVQATLDVIHTLVPLLESALPVKQMWHCWWNRHCLEDIFQSINHLANHSQQYGNMPVKRVIVCYLTRSTGLLFFWLLCHVDRRFVLMIS